MKKTFKKVITSALGATVFAGILGVAGGCGSASNNDQGVSFTAIGFAAQDDDGACTLDIGTTGVVVPITFGTTDEQLAVSGIISCILLQNNISSQAVRVERLYLSYHVPGASEQPPDTSIPLSVVLTPLNQEAPLDGGGSTGGGTGDGTTSGADTSGATQDEASTSEQSSIGGSTAKTSSLPSGFQGFGNRVSAPFFSVPPEIRQWLAFNREALPQTPFVMEITVYAQAITTGGDRLNSNPLSLFADVIEDRIIPPGDGSADGAAEAVDTDTSGDSGTTPSGDSFTDGSSGIDSGDSSVDGDTGDSSSGGGSSDTPVEETL